MRIRAPLDLGLAIRTRRHELGWSQTVLAERAGVGRQWLVAVEQGKSGAELGLVLRTLGALDLSLAITETTLLDHGAATDIDAVVAAAASPRDTS